MGDADQSYDFASIPLLVERLRDGYDLVMGNRFSGSIERDAMPWSHRFIGNPVLSWIGRVFFGSRVGTSTVDFAPSGVTHPWAGSLLHGMEFASEMVVKATLHHLRVTEVPITCIVTDAQGRLICAPGETAGATCVSCCSTARAGSS